jgi:hypothetical protein
VPEDESLVNSSEGHSAVAGPSSDLAEVSLVGGGASSEDDSDVFINALERLESPVLMSGSPTPINPDAELEALPEGDSILDEFPIRRNTNGRRMFPRYPYVHSLDWEDEASWQEHEMSQEMMDELDIVRLANLRASLAQSDADPSSLFATLPGGDNL